MMDGCAQILDIWKMLARETLEDPQFIMIPSGQNSKNILQSVPNQPGKRTSARVNFGTRTSAPNINFGTLLFHGAEVNISIELGVEVYRLVPK